MGALSRQSNAFSPSCEALDRFAFPCADGGFDTVRAYRPWGQFRLADGELIAVPFTVIAP